MSEENTQLLRSQISTIKVEDGTPIKFLPPNKSYKMFGVHINPMLDFRDHLKHVTIDIRKLAKALAKRLLSPNRKQLVIEQLLKAKYHATHLGIFTDKQLEHVDEILNKAARNALGHLLNNQTTYLVTQWSPEILTQEQIDACKNEEFQPKHIHPSINQTCTPTYEVHWQLAWQLESTIIESESGPRALAQYNKKTQTQRRTKRRTPIINQKTEEG
jgi:hypothetical protein